MKISDLILAVGDDAVRFQNLDQCASDLSYSAKHGTKIVFGTDQPLDLNGTKDLGLVVWLPRDAVAAALKELCVMAGSVIERARTQIIDGFVCHDDRPMTWPDADLKAGRRLDRRKLWAFVEGQLCESVSWSNACSGCYEGYDGDSARGGGCVECGYQGRVRNSEWVPTIALQAEQGAK